MAAPKLTSTEPYRVTAVGVSYLLPAVAYDEKGEEIEVQAHKLGTHGEEIQLTDAQARRLVGLNAVQPKDAPLGYKEQTVEDLEALAEKRGIEVVGTGANGGVLKGDLVSALETFDTGQSAAV